MKIKAKSPINLAISGFFSSNQPNSPISQPVNKKNNSEGMPTLLANLLEKILINNKMAAAKLTNSIEGMSDVLVSMKMLFFPCVLRWVMQVGCALESVKPAGLGFSLVL